MKRFIKSTLGVTLLEIMLVLAIAAMIIVMSVRYYQSANTSQQANSVLSQIQSIAAAADSLSQATGSYSGITGASIAPLLPAHGLQTPWGDQITVSGSSGGGNTYDVSIPGTPVGVCTIVSAQLGANAHFTGLSGCGTTAGSFSYTYISNP